MEPGCEEGAECSSVFWEKVSQAEVGRQESRAAPAKRGGSKTDSREKEGEAGEDRADQLRLWSSPAQEEARPSRKHASVSLSSPHPPLGVWNSSLGIEQSP